MPTSALLQLRQRYLNERREFHLEPNRTRLYVKDWNGETETFIPYETVTPTTRAITQQDGRLYMAALSFGILALIEFLLSFAGTSAWMRGAPVWAIASIVFLGFHFYQKRRYFLVDLTDRRSIYFLANQPSQEELDAFVHSMYQTRRKSLRQRYYFIDSVHDLSDELEKLKWLRKEEIISESGFQEMKAALSMQQKYHLNRRQTKGLLN